VVKPFIKAFVRPHGLEVAATPLFVEQIEAMAGLTVKQPRPELLAFVWNWAIDRLRRMRYNERYDRWILSEREQTVKARKRQNAERKAKERSAARKALRVADRK
jgi:hypothetical protein